MMSWKMKGKVRGHVVYIYEIILICFHSVPFVSSSAELPETFIHRFSTPPRLLQIKRRSADQEIGLALLHLHISLKR